MIEQLTWDNNVLNFVMSHTFSYVTQISEPDICTEVAIKNEREERGIFYTEMQYYFVAVL